MRRGCAAVSRSARRTGELVGLIDEREHVQAHPARAVT